VSKLLHQGMPRMVLSTLPAFEDELVTPPRRANNDRSVAHSTAGSSAPMVHSDALSSHGQGTPEGCTQASGESDPGASNDMTASWTAPPDFQTSPGTSPNLAPLSAVSASDPSILVLPDPKRRASRPVRRSACRTRRRRRSGRPSCSRRATR
jgi:hypothetical protein